MYVSARFTGKQKKREGFHLLFFFVCRWPDSNQHSIARSRFWVYRVYQFRHIGLKVHHDSNYPTYNEVLTHFLFALAIIPHLNRQIGVGVSIV